MSYHTKEISFGVIYLVSNVRVIITDEFIWKSSYAYGYSNSIKWMAFNNRAEYFIVRMLHKSGQSDIKLFS